MRSIRNRLLAWVVGALGLGALLIVGVAYLVILDETGDALDENLKQAALAVARASPLLPARRAPDAIPARLGSGQAQEADEFGIVSLVWSARGDLLFSSEPSAQVPFSAAAGSALLQAGGERWHVYSVAVADQVVQVAQRSRSRRMLAAETAGELVLPLAGLVSAIGVVLVLGLRRELATLRRAADDVAERSEVSLDAIELRDAPRELDPLIQSLNGLLRRLATALAVQRQFVADAAHELRTPIAALGLQAQLLERAHGPAEREQSLADLKAGIARSAHLVAQLLSLSRAEPEAPLPRVEPLDLAELARSVVGALSAQADRAQVDLGVEAAAGVVVPADLQQLTVLLNNLVVNALRYTPAGGIVTVHVDPGATGGPALLRVVDNGPGIAPGERERVFDRFYRAGTPAHDEAQAASGLGLAIVRAVARRHGAEVSLHTAPSGRGLEVRVAFPAAARAAG